MNAKEFKKVGRHLMISFAFLIYSYKKNFYIKSMKMAKNIIRYLPKMAKSVDFIECFWQKKIS